MANFEKEERSHELTLFSITYFLNTNSGETLQMTN